MQFLTDFADEAVVLPLIVAIGIALWLLGWRRGALAWIVTACLTLGAMLVLKLLAMACGPDHLRTPSGHTAAAAFVTGSLAAILFRARSLPSPPLAQPIASSLPSGGNDRPTSSFPRKRESTYGPADTPLRCVAAAITALIGAAIIGFSRLALDVHTLPEVLLGAAVGVGGAVGFAWLGGPPPQRLRLQWVAVAIIAALAIFHGNRLRAESRIWRAAYWISHDLKICRGVDPKIFLQERP